jgi:DNA-binding NarL/FixJ family response regulator
MHAQPKTRLLVVDDHELLAVAVAIALRLMGLDVEITTGPTVEAVLATVHRLAPVLVLLDLDLGPPLGSGLELIQPVIAAGGRVIMMTGVEEPARLGACVEVGAAGIVGKRSGFDNLVEAVRRAVEGEELLTDHDRARLLDDLRSHRQAVRDQVLALAH